MDYKKYENKAYNIHFIKTNKFKTIMVKINFKKPIEKEDTTKRNLLIKLLLESNNNYPSRQDIEIACEDLYNLSLSAENNISGKYIITSFSGMFLNEKYTEKDLNAKSLTFILDLLFNPSIINKEFKEFDNKKGIVEDEIKSIKDNPSRYSLRRLYEVMDKSLYYSPIGYIEDLNKINNKELYEYYLNMLKSDLIDIFIIGDIDNDIKTTIQKYFNINTIKKNNTNHFIEHDKIRKRVQTVKEYLPINQTKLNLGFKLDKLTDFEKQYVMYVYSFILGGSPNSKLFTNVREKNSLCYSISCSHKAVTNTMIISSGINFKDYEKCIKLIKKELLNMSKGKFDEDDIEAAKITYISSLKDVEDFEPSILKLYESSEYLKFDLLDTRYKSILSVTKEDVINLTHKIHLDTIYVLGGIDEDN